MDLSYLRNLSEGLSKNEILRELMITYGDDIWKFAFSLTRSRDLADDIRQDVFVKAYINLESFRGHSPPKNWLLAIARNAVKDHQKSAFFRKVTLIDFITDKGVQQSAEREYFKNEQLTDSWKLVMKLPLKLREVLVLYAHHQLSIAEIAVLLGLTESTVKVRLHRARTKANQIHTKSEGGYFEGS